MKMRAVTITMAIAMIIMLVQACSRPLAPQAACNFVQNPEQQRVSWKKRWPIKLYVNKSVPTKAYDAINRAIAEYKTKVGHGQDVFTVVEWGRDGDVDPEKDGYSTIYWFTSWDKTKPSEQARTTIYWTGSEIFEADLRINASNFTFNYGTNTDFTNVDLDSLVLHELGHVLGLAHNPTTGSVMNITLDDGQDRRAIGTVDETSLSCEY